MGDKAISHPKLHCFYANFTLRFYQFPDFFNLISLRNLTTLSLEFPIYSIPADPLINFLERSGPSLKSLSLAEAGPTLLGEELINVCLTTPQLTTLDLWFRPPGRYDVEEYLGPFFERLCLDPEQRDIPANEVPILPLLQTFILEMHGDFPWHLLPGMISPFNNGIHSTRRPLQKVVIKCYVDLEERMNDSDGSESSHSSDSGDDEGDITPDRKSTPKHERRFSIDDRLATINKFRRLREISYALIPDWDTYDMLWDFGRQLSTFQLLLSSEYQSHHEWDLFELSCLLLDLDDPQ
ncbi:hypothetical protein JR316_0000238 [Psilocybe cubensis]|nr:hypothetical protein JR316_0000238 [Psilocybe cubensis]KAH9486174.1 hypothetical protein JR316_0000238 [Psilocybe cubensis]